MIQTLVYSVIGTPSERRMKKLQPVLGRINAQLQLLTLAFPIKMLGALAALAGMATLLPQVFEKTAQHTMSTLTSLLP